jgi:uncharacterized SAM-binding protein YcdF (DUF218 family)
LLGLLVALGLLVYAEYSLYLTIRHQAALDEARPADAIVVFGAAQYNGVPSPVLQARLDHAFNLEEQGLAPLVITAGGPGGDRHYTEADVGRDYLIQKGMAEAMIIEENRGETTLQSVGAVAHMLRSQRKRTCLIVSDGFHLYRIKLMFSAQGITAYGCPAPESPIEADPFLRTMHSLREMAITSLWYLGIRR